MKRLLAWLWLAVTIAAGLHVASVLWQGLPLQTDLMALLPAEERDPVAQAAKDRIAHDVSQRVAVLVGHAERGQARAAAEALRRDLTAAGILDAAADIPAADALRRLGQVYFPHRAGLLTAADRARLQEGRGEEMVTRTLSQVFGVGGIADGRLLAADPFLLLPAFLADLPVPASRLIMDDGWPTVVEGGTTWVLMSGKLTTEAYAMDTQDRFMAAFAQGEEHAQAAAPGVQLLRLGAVFYAEAGARQAMDESSFIGAVSLGGSVALILVVFRAFSPLVLSMVALGAGMVFAASVSLLVFGKLHVIALMFGAGLIGVAVDYSLHYFGQVFAGLHDPHDRLRHVMTGLVLGLLTTMVGYAALALSPLPGLRQVAVFSAAGLMGSFAAVLLWFPYLDRTRPRPLTPALQVFSVSLWHLWEEPHLAPLRRGAMALVAVASAWGALHLTTDDDVRRQQSLDRVLQREQAEVQRLIGVGSGLQFYLVSAATTNTALELEERLGERLDRLRAEGALTGWRSPARFVPSPARQQADARLVAERLEAPHLHTLRTAIGLSETAAAPPPPAPLGLAEIGATGALPLLSTLILGEGRHLVALDSPTNLVALRTAADGLEGVRFIDPTADLSGLLGAYRQRALWLVAVSALLMAPLLVWRYGLRGALYTAVPPAAALLLTPALLAAAGLPFSFFAAMGLILLLSIGVDYAVFCAEADGSRDPITVLATWLATLTTLLSFGLLAFSQVAAVRSFGATMAVGIMLAVLLAPVAGRARPRRAGRPWWQ